MRLYDSMSLISLLAICLLQTTYIGCGFYATTFYEWYESNITKLNCNDIDSNIYVLIGKP